MMYQIFNFDTDAQRPFSHQSYLKSTDTYVYQ